MNYTPHTYTKHCQQRWAERFPDLDLETEFNRSGRCGRGSKKRIRPHLSERTAALMADTNTRYLRLNRHHNIVFVVSSISQAVITCYALPERLE